MSASRRARVKICGVTRPEDAVAAVELGADLLGLNFWPGSSRFLELAVAREVAAAAREASGTAPPTLVGVFVNERPQRAEGPAAAAVSGACGSRR